jgi:hypothetical protein
MFTVSKLKPDSATGIGLATAVGVYLIYNNALPNTTDIRAAHPHNEDVETCRKHAAWESAALLGLVFLVSRDLNSYIIAGVALIGIDLMHKHANAVSPATGKIDTSGGGVTIAPGLSSAYPMPDYDVTTEAS